MSWRHEVYRYGDLVDTDAFRSRARLSSPEVRSLRAHPYARPSDPAGVLLVRDGATIGAVRLITGRIRIGEVEHQLSWTSTWEFLGRPEESPGAGLLIARALQEAGSVAVCGVAARSRQIFGLLRFDEVVLPRWTLVVRSRPFLARRAPNVAAVMAPIIDAALRLLRAARGTPEREDGLMLELVATFDDRVDAVDAAQRGPLWFPRDHFELNWAIQHPWSADPSYAYRAFHLRSGERIVAYALARLRTVDGARLGSILRCGALTPAIGKLLIRRVSDALVAAGVDLVEVCSSRSWVNEAARANGMTRRGRIELMARLAGDAAAALRDRRIALRDADADLGEGDLLFF